MTKKTSEECLSLIKEDHNWKAGDKEDKKDKDKRGMATQCEWSQIEEDHKLEGRRGKLVRQFATSTSPSPPLLAPAR